MVKTRSLSHLALNPYRVVTDRRTDRIPIANTRSQQYLPVQLWRVKMRFCFNVLFFAATDSILQNFQCS